MTPRSKTFLARTLRAGHVAAAAALLAACAEEVPSAASRSQAAGCLVADEPTVVRTELAAATPARGERLLRFVQISDEHIMDEDGQAINGGSPLDPLHPALDSAMRFQDEYTDEVLNRMIATINACDRADDIEAVVATGDNTDLGTVAEVRRLIDNLDGTVDRMSAFEAKCREALPAGTPEEIAQAHCTRYTGRGVRDTQSAAPDPEFLLMQPVATRMALMLAETQRAAMLGRDASGGHDPRRQTATRSPGLPASLACEHGTPGCENLQLAVPYYVAFGNHDGYPRGTVVAEPGIQEASQGPGRHYMKEQHEFIDEFFATSAIPGPVGHGFNTVEPERRQDIDPRNDGYYAFDAGKKGAFRMIVLNTIVDGTDERIPAALRDIRNPFGLDSGWIDPPQFAWLQKELKSAHERGQLVLVFSHHPDGSFVEYSVFGDAAAPGVSASALNAELASYPNVVAWIAGHTHRHRIRTFKVQDGKGGNNVMQDVPVTCRGPGACAGFWQIETASLIDFPQEARLLEIFRTGGTGIIRATVLQHDFERSKRLAERDDRCAFYPTEPGHLQRLVTDADLSALCEQGGTRDGEARDRNVELMFRIPEGFAR